GSASRVRTIIERLSLPYFEFTALPNDLMLSPANSPGPDVAGRSPQREPRPLPPTRVRPIFVEIGILCQVKCPRLRRPAVRQGAVAGDRGHRAAAAYSPAT